MWSKKLLFFLSISVSAFVTANQAVEDPESYVETVELLEKSWALIAEFWAYITYIYHFDGIILMIM